MILEEDEDECVQLSAIQGLVDICIAHGDLSLTTSSQDQAFVISLEEVVKGLDHFVFHSNEQLQSAACEGLCRLFFYDKVRSIDHLSNLYLLYPF